MSATEIGNTLPRNTITVSGGRVQTLREWVLWNDEPWNTVCIERKSDNTFFASIGSPDGGHSDQGTLQEVIAGLAPDIQQEYLLLFGLEDANETAIRTLGSFDRYVVHTT
jgi:hypothetical protein